ncbi:MAG: zf-HC2 domain-containing protein [Phycisphaerales bacterium]|nr:MAG: zf-HC2 domain-containing protein [Phycisphaerales bacterium]
MRSKVSAYHDGELEPAQRDVVAAHLADCHACSAYLRDLGQIGRLLRQDRACQPPEDMWARIAAAAQGARPTRGSWAGGWLARAAAVAAGFLLYMLGYGTLRSSPQPNGTAYAAEAAHVEQILQETGDVLAGKSPLREQIGLLENTPEARLLSELVKDAKP